jgi:hypothetical protein
VEYSRLTNRISAVSLSFRIWRVRDTVVTRRPSHGSKRVAVLTIQTWVFLSSVVLFRWPDEMHECYSSLTAREWCPEESSCLVVSVSSHLVDTAFMMNAGTDEGRHSISEGEAPGRFQIIHKMLVLLSKFQLQHSYLGLERNLSKVLSLLFYGWSPGPGLQYSTGVED